MPEHTISDLLAGVIDLAPGGTPPHPPGPCGALCVPACAGGAAEPTIAAPPRVDRLVCDERLPNPV